MRNKFLKRFEQGLENYLKRNVKKGWKVRKMSV